MSVRALAKTILPPFAHFSGLSRALAVRYRGCGAIFALHSVVEDDTFHPDATLRCPIGKLEWALRWLRTQGFRFVNLDEAVDRLNARSSERFAVFTFDDGYADNLTRALPVMERFGAPFTVYVTTGMITREIDAWWFGLAALIRTKEQLDVPGLGRFDCSDPASKRRAFAAIELAIHRDFHLFPPLRTALAASNIDCGALVEREALSPDQLRRLANHPLATIGGHTVTHRNLAQARTDDVHSEMTANRKFLETATGRPVVHFAYPFGHARACGPREAAIARSIGFRTAVTTRHGMLFPPHRDHPHALPRLHLAGDDDRSTLSCKINGVYRAFHSRLGSPVAHM